MLLEVFRGYCKLVHPLYLIFLGVLLESIVSSILRRSEDLSI